MQSSAALSGIERQNLILELIQRQGRASVTALCQQFAISEATARRDLEMLASAGKIQRVHGGAIAIPQAPPELPVLEREVDQAEAKQRIGLRTAGLIADGETVFLGSGTTVLQVARALRDCRRTTVITNSLPVINTLADIPDITLVTLGGMLRASELSFIGHITEQALAEVRADKVVIGVRAIDIEQGLTNDYLPETMTDRAILNIGREVIVVADHTKFGRVSTAMLAPIQRIHTIVTDAHISPDDHAAFAGQGIRMIIV